MSQIPYREPDRKAPRFRLTAARSLGESYYKEFKKRNPGTNLTNKEIREIILAFNRAVIEKVVDFRDGVELPEGLGILFVGSCKKKVSPNVDAETSIKLGVKVNQQNWESNQWLAKIFYSNYANKYHFKDHELWYMTFSREFKQLVSKTYVKEFKKYVIIDGLRYIADLFRKRNFVFRAKKIEEEFKETYNPFEL